MGLQDALNDAAVATNTVTAMMPVKVLVVPRNALLEKLPALPVRCGVVLATAPDIAAALAACMQHACLIGRFTRSCN